MEWDTSDKLLKTWVNQDFIKWRNGQLLKQNSAKCIGEIHYKEIKYVCLPKFINYFSYRVLGQVVHIPRQIGK